VKAIINPTSLHGEAASRNEAVNFEQAESRAQLLYLPFVDLQSGSLLGLEAYAGLPLDDSSPTDYGVYPTIDGELALMPDIDERMLDTIFQDLQNWKEQGFSNARVAINISLLQFRETRLVDRFVAALTATGLRPDQLCLQITENHLIENPLLAETTLQQLKALGVRLVLDRFGAGFASLSYLRSHPFDVVKIDPSFIQTLDVDLEAAATTKAIIYMARSLGLNVRAAGVTTEAQCDFLRWNMCDEIQGLLYSPPLMRNQVASFLQQAPCLPEHLRRFQKRSRTLLLVDDEVNILTALKRLLRRDGYQILQANSGLEGLDLLARNDVDVIVSDQRMPGMTGVEFLREAKKLRPETVRIVLSGYTELQSVTDAINEGAIYKFLTKPWEDERLREHIGNAFKHKEMVDENRRLHLEIQEANHKMAAANRRLVEVLEQQRQQIASDEANLDVMRGILEGIPLAVIGLDNRETVVFANAAAHNLFEQGVVVLGENASKLMPDVIATVKIAGEQQPCAVKLNGNQCMVLAYTMDGSAEAHRRILILIPLWETADGHRIDP
jgi:EAL domain-containing protein (putative c-di-GMP-specific phosphodiesterase class I)